MKNVLKIDFEGKRIIIGRVGEKCGNVHLVDGKYWITDNALKADLLSNEVSYEYLELALMVIELGRYRIVSAQPSISQNTILSLSIPVPTFDIQKRIVNYVNEIRKEIKFKSDHVDLIKIKVRELFNQTIFE